MAKSLWCSRVDPAAVTAEARIEVDVARSRADRQVAADHHGVGMDRGPRAEADRSTVQDLQPA